MIYGSPRDRNMWSLVQFLRKWPVVPIVGSGQYLQQPVFVADVAAAVVQAASAAAAIGGSYNIPGGSPLTYKDIIDTICALLGRSVRKLHLPVRPVVAALSWTERLGMRAPLKAEQVLRLNEHKAFPYDEARAAFGYAPRTFDDGMREELRHLA